LGQALKVRNSVNIREFEDGSEKVFVVRDFVEVRIPLEKYRQILKRRDKEYIISFGEPRRVLSHITKRELVFVTKESGIPLMGSSAFGVIDRGTNLLQIRPVSGCNLRCIFCSVDEGKNSKTRVTDYIVDPDYLYEWVKKVSEFKGDGIEAHIDGQGEPLLYPYMTELLEQLNRIKEISTISMQTNGILLSERKFEAIEPFITRINLSISSLREEKSSMLAGIRYPVERVKRVAEMIANSRVDLLIAPVWVPGINDEDIEEIIRFALDVGAGRKYPPLGIQKYIPYRFGRRLKNVISFTEFYRKLGDWEKEYGVKLILKPEDFGMHRRKRFPHPFRKNDRVDGVVIARGRMRGEMLVESSNRVITVKGEYKTGRHIRMKIVRSKDGIFMGEVID
jgi:hypothetical protein